MQPNYQEYARQMRLELSLPEMVFPDGNIRHEYFLTKKGGYWGEKEDALLKRGLREFGYGEWSKIRDKYKLNYVDSAEQFVEEIELRSQHMLGLSPAELSNEQTIKKKIEGLALA